jgi:hypothetical protein
MLTTSLLPEKCHIIIEETIPRGMYVDPNQLRDLSESQGLQTFVAGNFRFQILIGTDVIKVNASKYQDRGFCIN